MLPGSPRSPAFIRYCQTVRSYHSVRPGEVLWARRAGLARPL